MTIAKGVVNFAPGITYPLRPFMRNHGGGTAQGGEGRARPACLAAIWISRRLRDGATLYLPVLVPGALFTTGDAHAAQGDGEVSGNALEASMTATLKFILHKGEGREMTNPYVEDKDNYYLLGQDPDLDKALSSAINGDGQIPGQAVWIEAPGCLFALLHRRRFRPWRRRWTRISPCTASCPNPGSGPNPLLAVSGEIRMKNLLLACCAMALLAGAAQAATHHLPSTLKTVRRGIISPDSKPVLSIKSGDTVVIDTVSHGGLVEGGPVKYFGAEGIPEKGVLKDAVEIMAAPRQPVSAAMS